MRDGVQHDKLLAFLQACYNNECIWGFPLHFTQPHQSDVTMHINRRYSIAHKELLAGRLQHHQGFCIF